MPDRKPLEFGARRVAQFHDTGTVGATDDVPTPPGAQHQNDVLDVIVLANGELRAYSRDDPEHPANKQRYADRNPDN